MPSPDPSGTSTCATSQAMSSVAQNARPCAAHSPLSAHSPWSTCSARRPRARACGSAASACSRAVESGPPLKATHSGPSGWASRAWRSASGSVRGLLTGGGLLLVAHVEMLAVAELALLGLEQADRVDQAAQLAVAPVARVELRRTLADHAAYRAQARPAGVVGGVLDRVAQQVDQARVLAQLLRAQGLRGRGRLFLAAVRLAEHVGVDEAVAGGDEGAGRLALAEAVDGQARLADAPRQRGEVAVAGDDAEAVEAAGVEQVHRIDDHRRVGGVLALGVAELLDRLDRQGEQLVLPAAQVVVGPVAVGALDVGGTV